MTAAWVWARAQLRRRMVAMLAIGLLAGLAGGATVAAITGAARTSSVYERHVESVSAPDAWVADTDGPWDPGSLDRYFALDGVETAVEVPTLALRPVGTDIYPVFDHLAAGSGDARLGHELARFRILEGRAYDPSQPDEVVITEDYAAATGLSVGDRAEFESWTDDGLFRMFDSNFSAGLRPDGPVVELTVVGLAREVQDLPTTTGSTGAVYLTVAFTKRWTDEIGKLPVLGAVWLSAGSDGFSSFEDAVLRRSDGASAGAFVLQPSADTAQVSGAIRAQVVALLVFAGVTAVSAAVVVFAILARQLSFASPDQEALSALGFTRRERLAAIVMVAVPSAVIAGLLAMGVAVAGSELLPVGTPGRVEPELGLRLDLLPHVGGALIVASVVLVLAGLAGASIVRLALQQPVAPVRPAWSTPLARWLRASPAGAIGMQFAFDRGRGRRSLPARSTLVGCSVGVVGIASSLVFATSLGHLESTPRLSGGSADFLVSAADGSIAGWDALASTLAQTPEVSEVATVVSVILEVDGEPADGIIVDLRRGDLVVDAIVSGRVPQAGDEMIIGRELADARDVGVGDEVDVAMSDGSLDKFEVVGIAALPNQIGTYNEMVAVLGTSADRFLVRDSIPWYGIALGLAEGVDPASMADSLFERDDIALIDQRGENPKAVRNLVEVRVFPKALAVVIGLLVVGFLSHALASGARRRAGELAVLNALGFSRLQLRSVTLVHATAIAATSLIFGVPIGLALGRTAWASTTQSLGLVTELRLPALPGMWIIGAVLIANLVGLAISRLAVSVKPAVELRARRE